MALNLKIDRLKELQAKKQAKKTHTILLVDDEPANLESIRLVLEQDYELFTANDGAEALQLIQSGDNAKRLHLIISDQRMPKMTGVELFIKSLPLIPNTIRIILTGYTDINAIISSINEGKIYKFLTKPIDPQDILMTVRRALESYDLEMENHRLITELQNLNASLEEKVLTRTQELLESNKQLEQQNLTLQASNRKNTEINQTKENLLAKLSKLYDKNLITLQSKLYQSLKNRSDTLDVLRQTIADVDLIEETLKPIKTLYFSEQSIKNKCVLLAEPDKKQQILAKMALGGTGVDLDIVSTLAEGQSAIASKQYDIFCLSGELLELAAIAYQKDPTLRIVYMTSEDIPTYLNKLRQYPYLSNIVSRHQDDRAFTLKSILTTISKLVTNDWFGLEKYLNWGTEVNHIQVTSSGVREHLNDQMSKDLSELGLRRMLIQKAAMCAEELLMNAIYDAPCDAEGKPKYNHLPRTVSVELLEHEFSQFYYSCDGLYLAISVVDPFGTLSKNTIIDYLESCYQGRAGELNREKGGAGRGLFQILETCDLMVINVKPQIKTEVIALFQVDPQQQALRQTTSFHYFGA